MNSAESLFESPEQNMVGASNLKNLRNVLTFKQYMAEF
jgi:hypothetical protein